MTKRKNIRKSNKILNPNANYYSWGGDFAKAFSNKAGSIKTAFSGANLGNALASGISDLGGVIGKGANSLISGGLSSGAGNAVANIGGVVGGALGKVNPLLGGIVSVGTGIIGGGINKLFGSKLNQETIDNIKSSNNVLNHLVLDNSSTQDMLSNWNAIDFGQDFTRADIGKDGVFSNKAKNTYKQLSNQQNAARTKAYNTFATGFQTADTASDLNLLSNSYAFGGPLMGINGAIDYDLANEGLNTQRIDTLIKNRITSMPNSFTSLKTFADGGSLHTNGADFTNGITLINNGGTHEENPMEGVLMGMDPEGNPNLVEEGEVVWNDYVFSNRIPVPKAIRRKYKLRGNKELTFADSAKDIQKESMERPNDPISIRGLQSMLGRLAYDQELIKEFSQLGAPKQGISAFGGNLYPLGGNLKHNNDVLATDDPLYKIYKDYLTDGKIDFSKLYDSNSEYSKRRAKVLEILKGDSEDAKKFKEWYASQLNAYNKGRTGYIDLTADDVTADLVGRLSSDGKLGFGHNIIFADSPLDIKEAPKYSREYIEPVIGLESMIKSPKELNLTEIISEDSPEKTVKPIKYSPWTHVPLYGMGAQVLLDSFGLNNPDYSELDRFEASINNAYNPISGNYIGNYLPYKPMDRRALVNKLDENSSRTLGAINNLSGGNRATAAAQMLAADKNYYEGIGDAFIKADEVNWGRLKDSEDFNRETNKFNATVRTDVDKFNSEILGKKASLLSSLATMRQGIKTAKDEEHALNFSAFLQGLGDYGRYMTDKDMIRWQAETGAGLNYDAKGNFYGNLDTAAPQVTSKADNKNGKPQKYGGKINTRRKKGFTI